MKRIQISVIFVFFLLLMIPMLFFNTEENAVSAIDNRLLANNPFGPNRPEGVVDMTAALENYVQDRIGFRDKMILLYTVLNDKLFNEMVHPSYEYGKDGYVFFRGGIREKYGAYHEAFVSMLTKMQRYCDERDIPFLFALTPRKEALFPDELPPGMIYDRSWLDQLLQKLDENGVRYVDNTGILREKIEAGEVVFNKKYDAGHWNELGAFYGVNNILSALREDFPALHINELSDFDIGQELRTTLPVSEFPISEYVPAFTSKAVLEDVTGQYAGEVKLNPSFQYFRDTINPARLAEGAPRVLVFQGSSLNDIFFKFLDNSLGEYIVVHDYQNVLNLAYYMNIFQPDCVIFEVAERTINNTYFDQEGMEKLCLNPPLEEMAQLPVRELHLEEGWLSVRTGASLTEIEARGLPEDAAYVYLKLGDAVFDMLPGTLEDGTEGYTAAVRNDAMTEDGPVVAAVSQDKSEMYVCN